MAYWMKGQGCCEEQCCDKCKEKKLEIVAWDCIDVDKSEEGVYVINNKKEVVVKSTDWTVNVETIEGTDEGDCRKVYDLSVDCVDKKVGVCDKDTPWYLSDKIKHKGAITIDYNCSKNGDITIGVDEDKLRIKDEKVAVTPGCSSKFLGDAIKINSSYIVGEVNEDTCEYVIRDKDSWMKPLMQVRLLNSDITQQQVARDWWWVKTDWDYVLAQNTGLISKDLIESTYSMELSVGEAKGSWITNGLNRAGCCVIPLDWIYRVTFGWTLEITWWVVAYRTYLYHVGAGANREIALESRGAGGRWVMNDISKEFFRCPRPTWVNNDGNSGNFSLGRFQTRHSFYGSNFVTCNVGDYFTLGVKISTSLNDETYDYWIPAQFGIMGQDEQWPGGGDRWAYYTLEWVAPLPR